MNVKGFETIRLSALGMCQELLDEVQVMSIGQRRILAWGLAAGVVATLCAQGLVKEEEEVNQLIKDLTAKIAGFAINYYIEPSQEPKQGVSVKTMMREGRY